MFRLEKCALVQNLPVPFLGGKACNPVSLSYRKSRVETTLSLYRSPFSKGGQGDFKKAPIRINF